MKYLIVLGFVFFTSFFCLFSQSTQVVYLSGTGMNKTVERDFFFTAGMNSGYWTKIGAPSCWELQGFRTYNCGRDKNKVNEKRLYKYAFNMPSAWRDLKVNIVFDGFMTDTEVKINGKLVGSIQQGAFFRLFFSSPRES
jgi:beta-galactosidase/beta-glucuronidase